MATHMNHPAGIRACMADVIAPDFYRFNSRWDGVVNGERLTVFAGTLNGDPTRGVLLVRSTPKDGVRKGGRHLEGPAGSYALRLIGWSGERLTVLAANGDAIWVEIAAGRSASRARTA